MSEMLHGLLPNTEYLEIPAAYGRRYGVWVTTPPGYEHATKALPLIYVMDGNFATGLTAPLIVAQADPYLSIAGYIQVSVGYTKGDADSWATLRNRDLVPPGEPVGDQTRATLDAARESGAMTSAQIEAYLAELSDTRADAFLEFLSDELHPHLAAQYRVSESGHGLFGYSYGGLFALYAWLRATSPFVTFGAGSPGVMSTDSQTLTLARTLPRQPERTTQRLHVTLNETELLGDVPVYRDMAQHVLTLLGELHATGRSADVTRALLQETHATGLQASFLSYLKTCHTQPRSLDQSPAPT